MITLSVAALQALPETGTNVLYAEADLAGCGCTCSTSCRVTCGPASCDNTAC
jgi:hypothetical protein